MTFINPLVHSRKDHGLGPGLQTLKEVIRSTVQFSARYLVHYVEIHTSLRLTQLQNIVRASGVLPRYPEFL